MLEVYVDAEKIHVEPPPPMSQQWGEINPQMSNQWGEYMNLLATPGLPPCSNTDYLAGTSNPDFGAGTSNLDFGAEPTQSHTPLSENFIPNENDVEDPTADSFVNESDEVSEPDEAEYPIPPEDGPDRVDINVMAGTFAQRGAETSSKPALPDMNTQPSFYRSTPFFQQTFPEIPADSVDVPNLRYAKFYNKSEGRLDKGMLFKTKEELMEAVQDHSIRHARREYYVTESSKTKWKVLCKHSTEDVTHLYTKYKYKLLIAAAMDGNQQVLPLAFAVVDEETYPSWKWFLQQLSRHVIRGRRGMCLISDRHGGLIKAVREGPDFVSPHGVHRYCLRHVCSNFNSTIKNVVLKDLCWQAGSEYQSRKFNRIMDEIKKQDVKAFAYLDAINKEKWTASHDGGWRCGILTTNMSECINGVLKGARRLPIFHAPSESLTSSFSGTSKWALKPDPKGVGGSGVSADALNPLRAYVSLPQVTFGPKRWQLPNSENSVLASTANDLRHDKYTPINPEKLKAAAAGLTQIGSAFAVATAVVFGGATVIFGLAASKLEVHNTNDIRAKGKDLIQPKFEMYREKLVPLRTWAEDVSKKWHLEREESLKEKPLIKELSRKLGAKTST
ncbi:UNVERIFIED_CONTAM: hypothetical protein Sradi_6454300 [Sesamum radiatum]|uniref:MULE transposase domain-containing protein n=1 Tax=Sesamum radiatum TaxID=300843 RepID=A0AAW2K496_SESRA